MSYTPPVTGQFRRVVNVAYAATITPNAQTTDVARIVLTGSPTIATPSGTPYDGQQMLLELIQDGTGNRTVTWGAGYVFSDDVPVPTLSTTAGKTDLVGIQYSTANSKWKVLATPRGY